MKRRVIIDTDPGLDDSIAILFALGCGKFEVLGLTTVGGNIGLQQTARNAGGLLAVMNRSDIPVICGADGPMARDGFDIVAAVHGADGLKGVPLPQPLTPPLSGAVEWMAKVLEEAEPASVDILALAPLTNVARLLTEHRHLTGRIGRIIAMGGTIKEPGNSGPRAEFNFASDPEAVSVVLGSPVKLTVIPLDVTRKFRAHVDYVNALPDTPHGKIARQLLTAYLQDGVRSRPLHDPCVMLLAVDPYLFTIERIPIDVDLGEEPDAGTLLVDRRSAPVDIAMGIDVERALELLRTGFI